MRSPGVAGYTLIEMVIVIGVLGILSALAIPRLGSYGATTLPSQAEAVADIVRRAQSLAVTRQTLTRVSVLSASTVAITTCTAVNVCTPTPLATYVPSQGVSVGALTIYFDSLGKPRNSVGADLPSSAQVSVTVSGGSLKVSVAALTGRVTVGP